MWRTEISTGQYGVEWYVDQMDLWRKKKFNTSPSDVKPKYRIHMSSGGRPSNLLYLADQNNHLIYIAIDTIF